jgi:hypothetical protein
LNVTFWLGVVLALVALWFLACFLFKPLGKFLSRIFNDAVESLEIKNENEGENE